MRGLVVEDISISFGGVRALKNVSFEVRPGEIVGLIGPNGAGKTSLVNCISRYYSPSSGRMSFGHVDLCKKKSYQLLRMGIARSFQELNLPAGLSVLDTVMLGQHAQIKTSLLRSLVDFSYLKKQERKYRRSARDIMRFFDEVRATSEKSQSELGFPDISGKAGFPDLLDVQDIPTSMLPYGIKKKVDLARAFASHPQLLLLDEPASGLGTADLDELIRFIKGAQKRFNTSILLVEHRMPLIMQLCDRVICLNFGEKIAEGTPQEIKSNPRVIEAYLGRQHEASGAAISAPVIKMSSRSQADLSEVLLEAKEVDVHYGPVKAISGLSLKISNSCITAIVGNNGAGKSSLMRAISGIERLANGEILFEGKRINHYLQEPRPDNIVRMGIAQVAEGRRIFKELSIMENLKIAGYTVGNRKVVAERIEKIFHYFPVLKTKLKLRDAGNLSGGQQQMVAIGQALIMKPRLLLLDEPSLGLSPNLVEELFETIARICRDENCAILLVEQNTEMALRYSTNAFVLETGFIVKRGKSAELVNDSEIRSLYLGG